MRGRRRHLTRWRGRESDVHQPGAGRLAPIQMKKSRAALQRERTHPPSMGRPHARCRNRVPVLPRVRTGSRRVLIGNARRWYALLTAVHSLRGYIEILRDTRHQSVSPLVQVFGPIPGERRLCCRYDAARNVYTRHPSTTCPANLSDLQVCLLRRDEAVRWSRHKSDIGARGVLQACVTTL